MRRIPPGLTLFARLVTAVFWLVCVAIPVGTLLWRLKSTAALFDPVVLSVAWATARQAILSTALSALIGLPLGLCAARVSPRLASWLDTLLLIPSGIPTVIAATAWVAWLGRSGLLARAGLHLDFAYSLKAVVLAHVFFNAPWIALLIAQARRQMTALPSEAAQTLGAGGFAEFRWVIWPELRWTFYSACAQVLAFCSMSFALVLILGGGPPVETLETALYSQLRSGSLDLGRAVVCAFWEMALTLPPWLWVLVLRSRSIQVAGDSQMRSLKVSRAGWIASGFAIFFLLPYLIVFIPAASASFGTNPWFDPGFWSAVQTPLRLSLGIAALTGVGTVILALLGVIASFAQPSVALLLALPGGISVLVLGLGAWVAYGSFLDPFSGSLAAIVLLQMTVFYPLAYRMLWPVAQRARRRPFEAAVTLGASSWRAFWFVDSPRWRAPVCSVFGLVASCALGEVAAVSLFYSENLIPLPLLISRWMGQYRFEEARTVAALLFLVSAAIMTGASRYSRSHREVFSEVIHGG